MLRCAGGEDEGQVTKAEGSSAKAAKAAKRREAARSKQRPQAETGSATRSPASWRRRQSPRCRSPPPASSAAADARRAAGAARYRTADALRRAVRREKIDVRWLPLQLPVASGALGVSIPAVAEELARVRSPGRQRSVPRDAVDRAHRRRQGAPRRDRIHVGRPPIARWTVAHFKGRRRRSRRPAAARRGDDAAGSRCSMRHDRPARRGAAGDDRGPRRSRCRSPTAARALALPCGNGEYAALLGGRRADKPICLVVDFDVFTQKEWKARSAYLAYRRGWIAVSASALRHAFVLLSPMPSTPPRMR